MAMPLGRTTVSITTRPIVAITTIAIATNQPRLRSGRTNPKAPDSLVVIVGSVGKTDINQ
jgi:hypothetical protein